MPSTNVKGRSEAKKITTETKNKIVPTKKTEDTLIDLLADFNEWAESTRDAVKAKRKALNDSGRKDIAAHKIIIKKVLIEQFKSSKWT